MRALITGGAGFIGYHLARELLKNGYNVVLVDSFSRGMDDIFLEELKKDKRVSVARVDLLCCGGMVELEEEFDYIYHLAAIIGVRNVIEHPYDVLKNNVALLLNMIEFARKQKRLKRFIFASTSEVYAGTLQYYDMEIPTPETTPLTVTPMENPRTSYMLSKIYGEALLQQSGIPFTIICPHNFYGPRMGMSHVIPELLKKAYFLGSGQKLEVFSISHKRTFCFISDAVTMIRKLAESDGSLGQVFNVGNESPEVSIGEVAGIILNATGKDIEIEARPATSGSPARRCPSMTKTREITGPCEVVSLKEGIERTFEWYRKFIFEGNELCAQ